MSTLTGEDHNSLFYPSVSAAYVFSETFNLPAWLTYGKIRGAYAQVSGDTDPYQLDLTYTLDNDNYDGISLQTIGNTTIPNKLLQPLLSKEFEAGLELSLFRRALDFQLTYYNRKTTQDIVKSSVSRTTGYTQAILNVGELSNKGLEIGIQASPIERGGFRWSVLAAFSYNKNNVDHLGESLSTIQIAESKTGAAYLHVEEGLPYSTIKGFQYLRDEGNNIVYDMNGYPKRAPTTAVLGSGIYDKLFGLTNEFTWKGLSLRVFVDSKFGGDIYSELNSLGVTHGKHQMTLNGRENGIIGEGVNESGEVNQIRVPVENLQQYYRNIAGFTEAFVYDASFVKLRELSVKYQLPKKLIGNWPITDASISFIGRNLAILYKNTPNIDPESNTLSGNAQGIAATVYPTTRSLGFNLNVKF